jgi:hypothetical protein
MFFLRGGAKYGERKAATRLKPILDNKICMTEASNSAGGGCVRTYRRMKSNTGCWNGKYGEM